MLLKEALKASVEFLRKAYSHRNPIREKGFWYGIFLMLVSWQLIGIGIVFHKIQNSTWLSSFVDYSYQMLLSTLLLLLISIGYAISKAKSLRSGWDYLKISRNNEILKDEEVRHLSYRGRIGAIYLRAIVATGGYYLFELAKVFVGVFDNSSLHGADALFYALLFGWWLENKTSKSPVYEAKAWIGMGISAGAIIFAFIFEVMETSLRNGVIGVFEGFSSAIALAIVIMLSGIVVYHDSIIRIAFHNCAFGGVVSSLIIIFTLGLSPVYSFSDLSEIISTINFKTASIAGACYSFALLGFLGSYKLIQPTLIAMMGNYLGISTGVLIFLRTGKIDLEIILVSIALIVGSIILGFSEWEKEKTREEK